MRTPQAGARPAPDIPAATAAVLLDNPVRPYAWGSATAIPDLLGVPPTGEPQAELWLGAHPAAPSRLRSGGTLAELVEADPLGELSAPVVERFGPRLPFLMKVLAAERPLSLQAHPDRDRARDGYAAQERRGIPKDAPERTYVDANHKPELVCALTPFDGLCGFRAVPETLRLLDLLAGPAPALAPYADALRARPDQRGLREVVGAILTGPAAARPELVASVAVACAELGAGPYRLERETVTELAQAYPDDAGVVITLLLNRVRLAPGEAMFLGAGNLHCYLRGTAVEVLASSDNVLRGGLTTKHVDAPELLRVLDVAAGPPPLLAPVPAGRGVLGYVPPVPDFRLDRITLGPQGSSLTTGGPQIVLTLSGSAVLDGALPLPRGASAWVSAGRPVSAASSASEDAVLARATTNLS